MYLETQSKEKLLQDRLEFIYSECEVIGNQLWVNITSPEMSCTINWLLRENHLLTFQDLIWKKYSIQYEVIYYYKEFDQPDKIFFPKKYTYNGMKEISKEEFDKIMKNSVRNKTKEKENE